MHNNHRFIESLSKFCLDNSLIREGEKIVVALSGGIDSMVLLNSLQNLKDRWKLSLVVTHFNHQLRGKESNEDENFVKSIAKESGIECYIERANTSLVAENQKLSIQETARNLRYNFFTKIRKSIGFSKIATGHNADDNTETILFNIFRGSGVHGLSGIPISRNDNDVIRPLLFATRQDIETYALENHIPYRIDSSNLKTDYARNFIRFNILPLIREKINPNISITLGRTSMLFNELEQYLAEETRKQLPDIIVKKSNDEILIDLKKLHTKPLFLQEHLLFQIAKEFAKHELNFTIARALHKTTFANPGTSCSIRMNILFYKDRDQGIFKQLKNILPFKYNIETQREYNLENFYFNSELVTKKEINKNPNIEYVDANLLGNELKLRNWIEGDWFFPFGMDGKKKISDFFIDEKVPIFKKSSIPILESNGNIVWICGMRLDDRFKITENTNRILKLTYQDKSK